MGKADRIVSFMLPGPLLSLDTRSERHDKGGTIRGMGGPGMAAIFGPGGPILKGDHPRRDIPKQRCSSHFARAEGKKSTIYISWP